MNKTSRGSRRTVPSHRDADPCVNDEKLRELERLERDLDRYRREQPQRLTANIRLGDLTKISQHFGTPTHNAMIESFNCRLRAEHLNENRFLSLDFAEE
ncbi:integrase core domain-containing protein [Lacipirellula limnantheis]|uniref:integrase core domain-containing protein n=1 Tax=Lacipirellula limnantheis TaxID=2528024 RepID=UPI0037045793